MFLSLAQIKAFLQNPELNFEGAGGRPAGTSGGVSPDPAQGGVQPHGARKIPDPHFRRDVRMGRAEPALRRAEDGFDRYIIRDI